MIPMHCRIIVLCVLMYRKTEGREGKLSQHSKQFSLNLQSKLLVPDWAECGRLDRCGADILGRQLRPAMR